MYKSDEKLALKKELKQLRDKGEAPDWVTWMSYQTMLGGYLWHDETPRQMYKRVAKNAAKYLPAKFREDYEDKFFHLFWNNYLAGSTPVLGNLGTDRGMAVSCSAQYCGDSLHEILHSAYESGMLSKYGFGTAVHFDLRDGYSKISTGGHSNNVKDWIEQGWFIQNKVTQSNLRRGSTAFYIDFWHGDLMEILPMLESHDRLHLGVVCDDLVKERLKMGDEEAWKRYQTVLMWRARKGKPYIIFIDNAKRQDPQCYKDKALSSKHSNLCITGDQRVVTNKGYLTAKELHEQGGDLILFDGEKAVEASSMKLREHSVPVLKFTLENGMEHKVTEYHGMAKYVKNANNNNVERVEAKDLKVGDFLAIQTKKGIFGTKSMEDEAFLLGLYQADGTQYNERIMFEIWEQDFDLEPEIVEKANNVRKKYGFTEYNGRSWPELRFTNCSVSNGTVSKKRMTSVVFSRALDFRKGEVPNWIWESDETTLWQYVRGLLYADGTAYISKNNGNPIQINLANINLNYLKQLQLIFNNLGLRSSIRVLSKEGKKNLPDGKGGYKLYNVKTCYRLIISNKNDALELEKHTGFLSRKKIILEDRIYRGNTKKAYAIKSIERVGNETVYCPTVYNDEHIFVCQGLKTFNCTEIFLHTDKEHTLSCVLSSMNATTFDQWKNTDALQTAIIFLDCVAQDLIERGKGVKGLEKVVRSTEKGRALGLGLLGFHTNLQYKGLPIDSVAARSWNEIIFKYMKEEAVKASQWLGQELGEPEWCKGTGMRNTHLLAIAPNTSSALIAGSVSQGIEPVVANVFTQKSAKGTVDRINPALLKLLRERGQYTEEVIEQIAFDKGSVKGLDFLSDEEKDVFKTAYEINQKVLIDLAEQRQKHICQGQSLNLFFDANEDEEWIHEVHKHAFEQKLLKSLYYVRTMPGITADKSDCVMCEA
jgi:ribonucleoside-diphosphate reductase alpha chain